jgi:signal transduction histidine kinase
MRSLQAKIALAYLSLAMLIVGLSAVALIELGRITDKVREGGKVAELFDATLEMRRFEKNHFLYGQSSDLEDHARYMERARELLKRDAAVIDALAGSGAAKQLEGDLARYAEAMAAHAGDPANEALAATVRARGNRIVTVGEGLALGERQSVDAALQAHRRNFLTLLAVVATILVVTGWMLARRVTRPLQAMESHMEAVASGQLTRLTPDSRDREFVSLTGAFNHVLDELERRQHTLVRAEKLASLGTMLSGVAHELNNPLSNISSSAQILKEDGESDPAFRAQLIADIDAETLRARRIVRALLDYSGERAFQPAPVPLAELVQETLRFLKTKRPAGVELKVDIAPELAVRGDRPRLQQVLLNLIINAYDAMGAQGELMISGRAVTVGEKGDDFPVRQGHCPIGSHAVDITIADTGPGIPLEILERVFDPFFTTKAVGHGSGLGLFIAFEIIEEHGGCLVAANRPEGGAEFRIRLPAASKEAQ